MPLYMDFHKFPSITIQEAKNAHVADQSIQAKYGVTYHQYWVNESVGTVFCLVEGPDKETCEMVHQTSHGHIACALVEVDRAHYELIMGNSQVDQWGLVHHDNGTVDLGYRSVMGITLVDRDERQNQNTPSSYREMIMDEIVRHEGRLVKRLPDDGIVGVFTNAGGALQCAFKLQKKMSSEKSSATGENKPAFKIGLSAGQPVTEYDEFFEEAINLAKRLSQIAAPNQIMVSSLMHELCEQEFKTENNAVKLLNKSEDTLVTNLFKALETNLSNDDFSINDLVRILGVSRPQLYRKIIALTAQKPNDLIRDFRLDKSLYLLRTRSGNISETALEVGFSNPSYFAKCFANRFGYLPSKITRHKA